MGDPATVPASGVVTPFANVSVWAAPVLVQKGGRARLPGTRQPEACFHRGDPVSQVLWLIPKRTGVRERLSVSRVFVSLQTRVRIADNSEHIRSNFLSLEMTEVFRPAVVVHLDFVQLLTPILCFQPLSANRRYGSGYYG
jgi:hypothetical protein